jgi:hypothetical protein
VAGGGGRKRAGEVALSQKHQSALHIRTNTLGNTHDRRSPPAAARAIARKHNPPSLPAARARARQTGQQQQALT